MLQYSTVECQYYTDNPIIMCVLLSVNPDEQCDIALDAVSKDANLDDVYYAIYCPLVEIVPHPTLCVFAVKPATYTIHILPYGTYCTCE